MALIEGYKGKIEINASTVIDFAGSWSAEITREVKASKPVILLTSTGAVEKANGKLDCTGSVEGQITAGANIGRAAILTALLTGTRPRLNFEQTSGLELNLPFAIITNLSISNDSEEVPTLSFDFENDGVFTLADQA